MRFPMYSPIHPSITLFKHPSIHPSFHSLISPPIFLPIYSHAHHLTIYHSFTHLSILPSLLQSLSSNTSTHPPWEPSIHLPTLNLSPIHLFIYQSSIQPSMNLYILYIPFSLFIHSSIHYPKSIHLSLSTLYPSNHPSIHPSSFYPSIHPPIYHSSTYSSMQPSSINHPFILLPICHQ